MSERAEQRRQTNMTLKTLEIQPYEDRGYYVAGDFAGWADGNWGEGEWEVEGKPFWMCVVAFPDDYESREEWEQSPDFTKPWWSGCRPPADGQEREWVRRFTHVVLKEHRPSVSQGGETTR